MQDLKYLKQHIALLDYLQQRNWTARPATRHEEFVGLCPLHRDTRPSFYVNARKNLFYCHGCGQGGDLIRFVELSEHLSFRQSLAFLQRQIAPADEDGVMKRAAAFYQLELQRHPEAVQYLQQRGLRDPALIEELGIGYARGGNLHRQLAAQGYSFDRLLDAGLINQQGRDTFCRRVIFSCCQHGRTVNLYGRSIGAAFPHRLLPRSKGGLFAWESVRGFPRVILVEGLFDLAVLWQAGFRNTTSAIGTHLTPAQWAPLCDRPARSVYLVFDQDENRAGQQALSARLWPATPRRSLGSALKTTPARGGGAVRRTSRQVLAQLSHLSRPRPGGLDAARWPRSCEVLALRLEDLNLADARIQVLGKGNRERVLPLPQELIDTLQNYLRLERPPTNSAFLFVCLKGRQRGQLLTLAGLRSLHSEGWLLPRPGGPKALYQTLLPALAEAAKRAGCSCPVTPHRLRHTLASEMLRLGVSLPALMQLLGHKDIRMTLRYVQVTQQDLQREFHTARQNAAQPHRLPALAVPNSSASADAPGIRQALAATRHLLEMHRRQLGNEKTRRRLQRLDQRLLAVASQLDRILTAEN